MAKGAARRQARVAARGAGTGTIAGAGRIRRQRGAGTTNLLAQVRQNAGAAARRVARRG
jgi:hypothetical protein